MGSPRAVRMIRSSTAGANDVNFTGLGQRIMVVDDRADIRKLLRDFLESEGYTVEALDNAVDALSRLAKFRPRVILLDILMPGVSGLSALQEIRTRHPEVAVIMVTGIGDLRTAKQSLALGAFDYVTKPIDFNYLTSSIEAGLLLGSSPRETDGNAGGTGRTPGPE